MKTQNKWIIRIVVATILLLALYSVSRAEVVSDFDYMGRLGPAAVPEQATDTPITLQMGEFGAIQPSGFVHHDNSMNSSLSASTTQISSNLSQNDLIANLQAQIDILKQMISVLQELVALQSK